MTEVKSAAMVVHEDDPYNAESPPTALAERVTPTELFYSRNHGPVPDLDPDDWRLEIGGRVARPLSLTLDQLQARFQVHRVTATLQCAGNHRAGLIAVRDIPGEAPWGDGAVGTATWTGARLSDVLTAAGAGDGPGLHVAFDAPDISPLADPPQPFGGSIPAERSRRGDVLLAWAMNDEPLPRLHGGPVRVVVPGYIGARSVKWVTGVTVQDQPSANYFQATAYRLVPPDADPAQPGAGISLGAFAVTSAITEPRAGDVVAAAPLTVRGYAVAGDGRQVARVDLSADGGRSWQQAALDTDPEPGVWRLWHAAVDLSGGGGSDVELVARAWDDTAAVQPDSAADLWNPKGYANNARPRTRVTVAASGAQPPSAAG